MKKFSLIEILIAFSRELRRDKRGATVAIAIGIAFVIMIFSFSVATIMNSTNLSLRSFRENARAQAIAESVMEDLVREVRGWDPGTSLTQEDCAKYVTAQFDFTDPDLQVQCEIKGHHEPGDQVDTDTTPTYTVPLVNTGNASTNCNPLSPVQFDSDLTTGDLPHAVDHPCNWGKLTFGNSVSSRVVIPLYYGNVIVDGSGNLVPGGITNPSDPLDKFEIWVRTPCTPEEITTGNYNGRECTPGDPCYKPREVCAYGDRYIPEVNDVFDINDNETVVNWQIVGQCVNGSCSILPFTDLDDLLNRGENNSEIFESKISNKYSGNLPIPLYKDSQGDIGNRSPVTIEDFLVSESTNSILQLAIIKDNLIDFDAKSIPYLEYQIRTSQPVANAFTRIKVTAQYKDQSFKIEKDLELDKKVIDFAIQN